MPYTCLSHSSTGNHGRTWILKEQGTKHTLADFNETINITQDGQTTTVPVMVVPTVLESFTDNFNSANRQSNE